MSNDKSQSSELYTTLLNVGLLTISLGFFYWFANQSPKPSKEATV